MELHFLGTGAAHPTPARGASSTVLRHPNGSCWMFDCGEGTQTQLMKSNIRPGKLDRIFITHLHDKTDKEQLNMSQLLNESIQTFQLYPNSNNTWNVLEDENMTVSAAILKHRIPCFGYVIQESDRPGKLNVALLKLKGIPPGPLYADVKNGKCIYAEDGSEIRPENVVGPPYPGQKVVILGDTCDSGKITALAINADVLVHEATNENAHKDKSVERGHSTPGMAARFAMSISAKTLILTHFSQRYKPPGADINPGEESTSKLLEEAKEEFGEDVIAAHDMLVVKIPRRTSEKARS